MTGRRIHVRKVIEFDYTLRGDDGGDLDSEEIPGHVRAELADPIGRAVDAFLNPLEGEKFTVHSCTVTVLGDPMPLSEEAAVDRAAAEFVDVPGLLVHRRVE